MEWKVTASFSLLRNEDIRNKNYISFIKDNIREDIFVRYQTCVSISGVFIQDVGDDGYPQRLMFCSF